MLECPSKKIDGLAPQVQITPQPTIENLKKARMSDIKLKKLKSIFA
jgi:hypothetical protein